MLAHRLGAVSSDGKYSVLAAPWWLRWLRRYGLLVYIGAPSVYADSVDELFVKFCKQVIGQRDEVCRKMELLSGKLAESLSAGTHTFLNLGCATLEVERFGASLLELHLKFRPLVIHVDVNQDTYGTDMSADVKTLLRDGARILASDIEAELRRARYVCDLALELEKSKETVK